MNSNKTNSLAFSVVALIATAIAPPAALAAETTFPGSYCSFQNPEIARQADKRNAAFHVVHSQLPYREVICPVPIDIPRGLQATQVSFNINVYVRDGRNSNGGRSRPSSCRVIQGHIGATTSSSQQRSPGLGNNAILSFKNVSFPLPLRQQAILRCWVEFGSTLRGYSVSTTDF